jgi:crotonobetainyl-CoA:carnitine CoA-transferase CaiB-like acyl-CoA transferase
LTGLRVLDLSRLMPFAYGTQLLVDAGASVTKLEAPGGEHGRGMPSAFDLTNRGKSSITLDLRLPQGRAIFLDLVSSFDAILESFRPGYMDGLGLGYDVVHGINPALVYCSGTGYGQSGPYAQRAGHDLNYAALTGLVSMPGVEPTVPLAPFIDMAVGWAAAFGLLGGMLQARLTGNGQHVDVSMADLAMSLNTLAIAETTHPEAGEGAAGPLAGYPWPDLMAQKCPCYGLFKTLDDRLVALGNVEPKFWRTFLEVIDRPDLEGDRFATGAAGERARRQIETVIGSRPLAEWDSVFSNVDVCYAPVNHPETALRDPHLLSRETVKQLPDGSWRVRSPVRYSDGDGTGESPAPAPGEANAEVYGHLGHDHAQLQKWREEGVI